MGQKAAKNLIVCLFEPSFLSQSGYSFQFHKKKLKISLVVGTGLYQAAKKSRPKLNCKKQIKIKSNNLGRGRSGLWTGELQKIFVSLSLLFPAQLSNYDFFSKAFSKQIIILLFAASEPKKGKLRKFSDKLPLAEVVDQ